MGGGRQGSRLYSFLMFLVASVLAGLLVAGLAVPMVALAAGSVKAAANGLEDLPQDLTAPPQQQASNVLLADGSVLASFYDQNRSYVPLDQISPEMQKAQLAIEDHRFYHHGAIDLTGMARAAAGNVAGSSTSGGSTLTQQYVKLVRVQIAQENGDEDGMRRAQEQTISRKIIEMRYAVAMEKKLSKDQILERYLNIAYYGDQTYGVQAAATHYFGIDAKDLNLEQSALLAGLVQSPSVTDPVNYTAAALQRRNVVLNRVLQLDTEDPAWFQGIEPTNEAAVAEMKAYGFDTDRVIPNRDGCVGSRYPFICDYVKRTLLSDQMPGLGSTSAEREASLNRGGLTIQTVIDPVAQDQTQQAVSAMIDPRDPVVAGSALVEPRTGLIVAMAQSRPTMGGDKDAGETYHNYNVPLNMGGNEGYQAGSTFKTFTLAAALNEGVGLGRTYSAPGSMEFGGQTFTSCDGPFKTGPYAPKNASSSSAGTIDLLTATRNSVNTFFVQLERDIGICDSVRMAKAAGVVASVPGSNGQTDLQNGTTDIEEGWNMDLYPAFVLGIMEVSPLTMARAYGTFANNGIYCDSIILKSVVTRQGEEVPVPSANCRQTIDPNVAAGVSYALNVVITQGTGRAALAPGGWPQAGKTGTIDGSSAVWFSGYTPELAGSAFIAKDKESSYWKETGRSGVANMVLPYSKTYLGGSGGGDAGRIWKGMMTQALQSRPKTPFPEFRWVGDTRPKPKSTATRPNNRRTTEARPADEQDAQNEERPGG